MKFGEMFFVIVGGLLSPPPPFPDEPYNCTQYPDWDEPLEEREPERRALLDGCLVRLADDCRGVLPLRIAVEGDGVVPQS